MSLYILVFVCQLSYGKFFATQTSMIENVSTYEVGSEKVFSVLYCSDIMCGGVMQSEIC